MLESRAEGMTWVEPFVGGANMIDKVDGERIGADLNKYLIEALLTIRDNINDIPKSNEDFTEEDYKQLRKNDRYRFKGYAGFAFSYSGKWLRGWCRDKENKRDYVAESFRNAIKQNPKLQGVDFVNSSYGELDIPPNSLIYCDPPYEGTEKYKDDFNHNEFWDWCREKAKEGHQVFVSEYNAPDDFQCVWEMEVNSSLTKDTGSKKATEKLFKVTK